MIIPGIFAQRKAGGTVGPKQSILNSLVSWWDFETQVSFAFPDMAGTCPLKRDSTLGTYHTTDGKVGTALKLVASIHAYVDVVDGAPLVFGDESFSMAFWHYRDSTNNPASGAVAYLAGRYSTTGDARSYTCRVAGGVTDDTYQFGVSADGINVVSVAGDVYSYTPGWDFIVCGYDKAAGHIFISLNNGAKVTTPHTGGVYSGGSSVFAVGTSKTSGGATAGNKYGRYDSVAVVGKALTIDEIAALWNSGVGLDYAALSGSDSVKVMASTGTSYIASGTVISAPSSPAEILDGDGLFAVLMGRSAITPPAGWTLLESLAAPAGFTHTINVYRKDTVTMADSATAFAWTSAASGRTGLAYVTARSTTGAMQILETASEGIANASTSSHSVPTPVLTATANGELFLMGATSTFSGGSANTWTPPTGAELRTTASQTDNRLAAAVQSRNSGQSNSSPWTFAPNATASEFAAATIRIAPL